MLRTGDKIQILATVVLITGCVVSVIAGLVMLGTFTVAGITTIVVGVLSSVVFGAVLNGFGELINQTAETNRKLENIADSLDRLTIKETKQPEGKDDTKSPETDWQPNTDDFLVPTGYGKGKKVF